MKVTQKEKDRSHNQRHFPEIPDLNRETETRARSGNIYPVNKNNRSIERDVALRTILKDCGKGLFCDKPSAPILAFISGDPP